MRYLMSPAAVARRLRVSVSSAKRYMATGALRAVRDSRGWLFARPEDVSVFNRRRGLRVREVRPKGLDETG
jgi:predicted site-specific integrase-resolvase